MASGSRRTYERRCAPFIAPLKTCPELVSEIAARCAHGGLINRRRHQAPDTRHRRADTMKRSLKRSEKGERRKMREQPGQESRRRSKHRRAAFPASAQAVSTCLTLPCCQPAARTATGWNEKAFDTWSGTTACEKGGHHRAARGLHGFHRFMTGAQSGRLNTAPTIASDQRHLQRGQGTDGQDQERNGLNDFTDHIAREELHSHRLLELNIWRPAAPNALGFHPLER